MLRRFVPQKPMPPVREEPRDLITDDNNHPANDEEPKLRPTIIDNPNPKPMADHGGKDILSSDVEIKGSIKFQKELLIDGKVEGDINSDGVLTVGENAEIRGEIKTKSITVYGKVHGNITVGERCELKSRSEEHTSELQSQSNLVCRLLLEKKKKIPYTIAPGHRHRHSVFSDLVACSST